MTFHHATREQAGIYEVVGEMWSDLDPGDWGVLRTGQVRMIFSRRRPGAGGGVLPIIDWGPDFVENGQLRKVRDRVHQKAIDGHTGRRRDAWRTAAARFSLCMSADDLREPLLRAITECPGLPSSAFWDLVTPPVTFGQMLAAYKSHGPLEIDEGPVNAVEEALRQLTEEGLVEARYLAVGPGWGRNDTKRWYAT